MKDTLYVTEEGGIVDLKEVQVVYPKDSGYKVEIFAGVYGISVRLCTLTKESYMAYLADIHKRLKEAKK
jgi:hypothetical protein